MNNPWLQTYTGKQFFPFDPSNLANFDILDIAHALSNICRFNGHCLEFYSVAQHSVLVSQVVSQLGGTPEEIKWGLIHDVGEAYLGDIPRPVKAWAGNLPYVELRICVKLCEQFDLPARQPDIVKKADLMMLAAEAKQIMAPWPADWELSEPPADILIQPLDPFGAKELFLQRFKELFDK